MPKIYHCYYDECAQQAHELPGILYLKKKGQFCLYDSKNNIFLGPDLQPIDINGCIIIPPDKEIPKVIRIKPEVLKRLKDEHKI